MKNNKIASSPETDIERKSSIKELRIEKETPEGGRFKLHVVELEVEWNSEEGRLAAMNALGDAVKKITGGEE
ncbi:MAG: hypothetical protein M3209_09590 [Acidobacteriota bacterium]|nr:hypothetical protein [Acidobacteriota bacterium]